jgi:acyl-CoA thioesterase-1
LRAKGYDVEVINSGVNGETTRAMPERLDQAVPEGTRVVILQPGGNDRRKGLEAQRADTIAEILTRLNARRIRVIMLENSMLRALPHQADGQHLTPEGYRVLAEMLAPQVAAALDQ